MGTSATRAKNKYNAANYDYIRILVPKGRKDIIKAFAEAKGESVNSFITKLINEAMGENNK